MIPDANLSVTRAIPPHAGRRRREPELFWLSDEQWAAIAPVLPANRIGPRRKDDRRIISGIIHVVRAGCTWADCPAEYGCPNTIYSRFAQWSRRGIWKAVRRALVEAGWRPEAEALDFASVTARRRQEPRGRRPHGCASPESGYGEAGRMS
jgi:transposase